jgi:hypothetical protein
LLPALVENPVGELGICLAEVKLGHGRFVAADAACGGIDDYPAEHWVHLRTTNPIESTFGTVRSPRAPARGRVAMALKLIESAQARWRAVNAPHLVALVRAGARFENGKLVERPDESGGDQQAV